MATDSAIDDFVTVQEAAEIMGLSRQRIHQLIPTYDLEYRQIGEFLLILRRKDIERLSRIERPSGIHVGKQNKGQKRR